MKQLKYFLKVNFNFTYLFIAICLVLFVISWIPSFLSGGGLDADSNMLITLGANFGSLVRSGELFRLITSNFLHGSVLHIAFNMYALYSIGTFTEIYFSRKKFFIVFIITGFIASLTSFVFSNGFSVGASGAIFGLLGLLLSQTILGEKSYRSELPIDKRSLITIIVINLIFGFVIPGVDNFAHIGGLISGFVLGFVIKSANAEIDSKLNSIILNTLLVVSIALSLYGLLGLLLNIFSH